ncbi:hypothetical protein PgNI_10730 [Pyricularia grisea]|uniref:Zn(2)-C6 fungal-type domain-containing protein n=1 Tax=Pyricularia grisea TaxID=148305 RepID=A0A6P8AYW9_PYRGI|nr:hypothetical protein PgNI_10730 [Pyricularia grisea]TLD07446.1 hypothetical protein PgNI_10730 [Pyricularia grisea]
MRSSRVRVVPGSCWPCKKRRVKCDLAKPVCRRCAEDGAQGQDDVRCDYNTRLIRWSTRPPVRSNNPSPATPPTVCSSVIFSPGLANDGLLSQGERRALHYFHARIWPLLQCAEAPRSPPLPFAIENRVVLLTTCVLADSHRLLQEGQETEVVRRGGLGPKRAECLAEIRSRVDSCLFDKRPPMVLLFAVLLLYLHDGFIEFVTGFVSTSSHHKGVMALVGQMGGIERVLRRSEPSLQMLLAEFVSADLTTSLLHSRPPSFPASVWTTVDEGAVWWNRDPLQRASLAKVFGDMSAMSFYLESIRSGQVEMSMDTVRMFEQSFLPSYGTPAIKLEPTSSNPPSPTNDDRRNVVTTREDVTAVHAFALIRAFQHAALIFLYRAICRLPIIHPLVHQHVQAGIQSLLEIDRKSKSLNCIIFPLYVVGAHAKLPEHRDTVLDLVNLLYENMRFASVRAVMRELQAVWSSNAQDLTWQELFGGLDSNVLVL